jgi:hypothetical protein
MTGTGGTGTFRAELIGEARHGLTSQPAPVIAAVERDVSADGDRAGERAMAGGGEFGAGTAVAHDEEAASTRARIAALRTATAQTLPETCIVPPHVTARPVVALGRPGMRHERSPLLWRLDEVRGEIV